MSRLKAKTVFVGLTLSSCRQSNQTFAVFGDRHDERRCPAAFRDFDDFCGLALHDGYEQICGPRINAIDRVWFGCRCGVETGAEGEKGTAGLECALEAARNLLGTGGVCCMWEGSVGGWVGRRGKRGKRDDAHERRRNKTSTDKRAGIKVSWPGNQ